MTTRNTPIVQISLNFSGRVGRGLPSGVQQPGRLLRGPCGGFMASREKVYSDPLLVEIRWHTNTKFHESVV